MKFQIKSAVLASVGLVAAAAAQTTSTTFTLEAVRPGDAVDSMAVGASISNLWLNLPEQNATCRYPIDEDIATFYLRDGALYLYATHAAPQMLYADRSGMGMSSLEFPYVTLSPPQLFPFLDSSPSLTSKKVKARLDTSLPVREGPDTPSSKAGPLTTRATST